MIQNKLKKQRFSSTGCSEVTGMFASSMITVTFDLLPLYGWRYGKLHTLKNLQWTFQKQRFVKPAF